MYQAKIEFRSVLDDYDKGESLTADNIWYETITASSKEVLREKIADLCYITDWKDVDSEQINEYSHATEYAYSALVDNYNEQASASQIAEWKQGKRQLWAMYCHILVSEVIEKKASL